MARSNLIKDTTREERIAIVAEALGGEDGCDCMVMSAGVERMYQPYIEGELELFECNMQSSATSYVVSGNDRSPRGLRPC